MARTRVTVRSRFITALWASPAQHRAEKAMHSVSSSPAWAQPARTALLLIDFLRPYDASLPTETADAVMAAARWTKRLRGASFRAGIPCCFVNGSFGFVQSSSLVFLRDLSKGDSLSRGVLELLAPTKEDYFLFKPFPSAFDATRLDELLRSKDIDRVILAGVDAGGSLFITAKDAYVFGVELWMPPDCIVSTVLPTPTASLQQASRTVQARTRSFGGRLI